ncbi:MAG: hypothetical protein IKB95_02255 [Bacteroidales bacterium]|nr:hypothetical protein [Bacteroidales bacterium]
MKQTTLPSVLAVQTMRKEYHKPTFEVIDLNMESPLLAGSGTPTPKINPIKPSNETW